MNIRVIGLLSILLLSQGARAQTPLVGIGDSIGQGVQSGDANQFTQPFSYLNWVARQMNVRFPLPLIQGSPLGLVGSTFGRTRIDPTLQAANLAVSGANVSSILLEQSHFIQTTETDLVLSPRIGTQVEVAEILQPGAIICFVGNNDVLRAAVNFDELNATQMTSVADFTLYYRQLATRLQALKKPVVVGTIPNVTQVAFLMDRAALKTFTGKDLALRPGYFTTLVAGVLLRLGLAGPDLLENPDWVLDPDEITRIRQRAQAFNQVIIAEAKARNFAVADVDALINTMASNPPVLGGVKLSGAYLGGSFSLDGIHPSNTVHAIIANEFLSAFNKHYGFRYPLIGALALNVIAVTDPFVDRNGNGVVAGRPFTGLLETLAPFLGLSGDNEFLTPTRRSFGDAQRFLSEYRRSTGRRATGNIKAETISTLRHILGIDTLNSKHVRATTIQ